MPASAVWRRVEELRSPAGRSLVGRTDDPRASTCGRWSDVGLVELVLLERVPASERLVPYRFCLSESMVHPPLVLAAFHAKHMVAGETSPRAEILLAGDSISRRELSRTPGRG